MTRKKIIFFADWFEPGYKAGGPIRSVANMVKVLSKYHEIFVVTRNTDFNSTTPYENIKPNTWIKEDWGAVKYFAETELTEDNFASIFKEIQPDYIHLNSFFSPKFTLLPLKLAKKNQVKSILAPRGMLGAGALAIKKLKKSIFIKQAKLRGIYKDVIWHASTEMELNEIQHVFGEKAKIKVAINLTHAELGSPEELSNKKDKEKIRFVFLSRISEKKNLKFALSLFQNISNPEKMSFDIFGPIEDDDYWKSCQEIIKKLNIDVQYHGELTYEEVKPTFEKYHCMILPTQHENFGHVFIESWANGCMTLISDQTPWRNLQSQQVGFDLPLDKRDEFVKSIEEISQYSPQEIDARIKHCVEFSRSIIWNEENIQKNLNLFDE